MPNPLDGLGAILLGNADVVALVGSRVYWPQLPASAASGSPQPAVVLRPAGGDLRYGPGMLELTDPRVDTDCYGSTLAQSWTVYLAVRAAFKNTIRVSAGGMLVHSCQITTGGVTDVDPDTKWPLTIASFSPVISELTAA